MEVYAQVNNCVIMEDDKNIFWVYDRNEELLSLAAFEFAADAISFAYKYEKGLLCE